MTDDSTTGESTETTATDSPTNGHREVDPDLATAITRRSDPISSVDPHGGIGAMAPVGEAVADARIVGLGEATHGSREHFEAKAAVLQYLVEAQGLRAIALEANYPEAKAIDRYVRRGEGDPESALEGLGLWPWYTRELLNLLEWLRSFNADRPPGDRVRFFGVDVQFTPGAARRLRAVLDAAGDRGVPPGDSESLRADLSTLVDPGIDPYETDGREERIAAARRAIAALREWLRRPEVREAFPLAAGAEWLSLRETRQHGTILEQATAHAETVAAADGDYSEATIRTREVATARNVAWLLESEGVDRIAVWAHNAHVNRCFEQADDYATTSMGGYLADWYGEDYYALGLEFARGSFQAIGPADVGGDGGDDPDESDAGGDEEGGTAQELREWTLTEPLAEVGAAFAASDHDLAVLDFETAREDPRLATWLDGQRGTHRIGAVFDPGETEEYVRTFELGEAFDGLLYVEETTRARYLGDP